MSYIVCEIWTDKSGWMCCLLSLHHKGSSKIACLRIKKGPDNINTWNNRPSTHCHLSRQFPSSFHRLFSSQAATQTFCPSKMVSFLEVLVFVIWLIGELGWAKTSSEMISLVVNWKDSSTQHKWSISVHCLEFRKTPSAALCTNVRGRFSFSFPFCGESTPPNV